MNKQLWYENGAKRHWLKRRPAPTVCSSGRVYQKPDISMFGYYQGRQLFFSLKQRKRNGPLITCREETARSLRIPPVTLELRPAPSTLTVQTLKRDHALLATRINAHRPSVIVLRRDAHGLPGGNGQFVGEVGDECAFDEGGKRGCSWHALHAHRDGTARPRGKC